jgi:putative transposase
MLSFAPGVHVRLDGERMVIVATEVLDGVEHWILRRRRDGQAVRKPRDELELLYERENLVRDYDEDTLLPATREARRRRRSASVADLKPEVRARFDAIPAFLAALDEAVPPGTGDTIIKEGENTGKTHLEVAIAKLGPLHGLQASRPTVYRWRKAFREGDPRRAQVGDHKAKGNRRQLAPEVLVIVRRVQTERLFGAQTDGVDRRKLVSKKDIRAAIEEELKAANLRRPGLAPLTVPAASTLQDHWNKLPAYERDVAKHGPTRAAAMYRGPKGHEGPKHPLDLVEYDETQLPIFLFDEVLGTPLGRPWLAWFICRRTHCILGVYVGYEPASDISILSAARMACLTKGWIAEHYRETIENRWEPGGVGRTWVLDNSLCAWSGTVDDMTANLNSHTKWTRVRMPWLKALVESMFDVLNDSLLSGMPGFVLGKSVDVVDYDPRTMGCVGLRVFLAILFKWVVDVYHVSPHGLSKAPPLLSWRQGIVASPPGYPDSVADLAVIFGLTRHGTVNRRLDHGGIVVEGLDFYSPELDALRRRNGDVLHTKCKLNGGDLGTIRVHDPKLDIWVPAYARDQEYARGLSLHVHKLHRKLARERFGGTDIGRLQEAQLALSRMISGAPLVMNAIRTNARLARAVGIGTEDLIRLVDGTGNLVLGGKLAGMQLDPYAGSAPLGGPAYSVIDGLGAPQACATSLAVAPRKVAARQPALAVPPAAMTAPAPTASPPAAPRDPEPRKPCERLGGSPFDDVPFIKADRSIGRGPTEH